MYRVWWSERRHAGSGQGPGIAGRREARGEDIRYVGCGAEGCVGRAREERDVGRSVGVVGRAGNDIGHVAGARREKEGRGESGGGTGWGRGSRDGLAAIWR